MSSGVKCAAPASTASRVSLDSALGEQLSSREQRPEGFGEVKLEVSDNRAWILTKSGPF